jgi:hypothetical protein
MSKITKFFKILYALSLFITGATHAAPPPAVCPSLGATISDTAPFASFNSQIGIDEDGYAIAAWFEYNPNTDTSYVASATLPKGGVWSTPVYIASFSGFENIFPQIAVSHSTGNAVVIWNKTVGANSFIMASVRPANTGIWSTPQTISSGSSTSFSQNQQLAINTVAPNDDYAVAIWRQNNGSNNFLQTAEIHIVNFIEGPWSAPFDVVQGATDEYEEPKIAIDTLGIAYTIWTNTTAFPRIVQAATHFTPLDGASWNTPTTLSNPTLFSQFPDIAAGSAGFAVATWVSSTAGTNYFVYASRFMSGNWSTPDPISLVSDFASETAVEIGPMNAAVAVWREQVPNSRISSAYRAFASVAWDSPLEISTPLTDNFNPNVGFDDFGNTYAVWTLDNGSNTGVGTIEFSAAVGGGSWSTPCNTLSPPANMSDTPHIAVDPTGYAVIAWNTSDGVLLFEVQATVFPPPTPPVVTSVTPTSGSASGGNVVIITGTGFTGASQVAFGAALSPSFTVVSSTEIIATVPQGVPGTVNVTVTTAGGTSAITPADQYTYISPICWQR